MKQKSLAALLLVGVLFSGFAVDWPAVADTELEPGPVRSAEEARVFEAVPRVRRVGALAGTGPGTGLFEVRLDVPPQTVSRAFLTYELAGVPHWTAAVRSVNGLPRHGGFGAVPSSGMALQVEEINPSWLRPGVNQIAFFPAGDPEAGDAVPYTVRNLRLVLAGQGVRPLAPRLTVTHPLGGEQGDEGAQVRGFVDPAVQPAGPAELFVNGTHMAGGIDLQDGAFAAFVPRTAAEDEPWEIEIEVVYPDGIRLRQRVRLPAASPGEDEDDGKPGDDTAEADAGPGTAKSLALGKARLDVTADALAGKVKLTMRGLRPDELPALDAGMTNVTPGKGGFRMGPHGLRFKKPVELTLPYDAALIPQGMTLADVQTFYFDEEAGRWLPLPRLDAKAGGDTITSLTDHFTDFINGTLALPDEPSGASFSPNSLQELAKADPASGIVQIAPPEGGPTGDATLDFPIVVPPGRRGRQPQLSVHYSSSGGDGWLGMGWDLRLPSIEILTLFGVPRYDGTERYLMDGEQLVPAAPGSTVFVRRIEGSFERIVRKGTGPADYSWEVTDKDGVRYLYGDTDASRLRAPAPPANIFRWHLRQVIDPHGNTIDYSYFRDEGGGGADGEPWVEVYPAEIAYTSGPGADPHYKVRFVLDDGNQRPDRMSSGRQGFKTYMRHRLDRVEVLAGTDVVRSYLFQYRVGDFSKSLLQLITAQGEGGTDDFYQHRFTYHSAETGFGGPVSWGSLSATEGQSETQNISGGAHFFIGGAPDTLCINHGGVQVGGGGGGTNTRALFLDVNGDGLTDRIADDGSVAFNTLQGGFSGSGHFSGTSDLGHTLQRSFDLGAGGHLFKDTLIFGTNWSWNHSNDDKAVADVDGDGLPDLIDSGSVRFNSGTQFGGGGDAWSGGGFDFAIPGEKSDLFSNFKLSNPLRKLVLPADGLVQITGAVQKQEPGGDGVIVEIHYNGIPVPIWKRAIAAGDVSACTPAPGNACGDGLVLQVEKGDRLYFLASAIERTDHDALLWAPRVSYVLPVAPVLATGSELVLPLDGTVVINGAVRKGEPGGGVAAAILQGFSRPDARVVWQSTIADGDPCVPGPNNSCGGGLTLEVHKGERLFFFAGSNNLLWVPWVTYTSGATVSDAREDFRLTGDETAGWTAPAPGKVRVLGTLVKNAPVGVTLTVGRDREVVYQRTFSAIELGSFDVVLPDLVTVVPGQVLRFHVSSSTPIDPALVQWSPTVTYEGGTYCRLPDGILNPVCGSPVCQEDPASGQRICSIDGDPGAGRIPGNVLTQSATPWMDVLPAPGKEEVLSGGYRGWFYGEWNGNEPFHESGLKRPKDEDEEINYVPAQPDPARSVWKAAGFDLYLSSEGVKPSRRGGDVANDLDVANGGAGGGIDLVRKTTSATVGIDVSVGAGGISLSCGASDTQLDLIDLNGDSYPDQVTGGSTLSTTVGGVSGCVGLAGLVAGSDGAVRLGNGGGEFAEPFRFAGLESPVRRTADASLGLNAGLSLNVPRKSGEGETKAVNTILPSVGSALSLSQTTTDLVDVNGDGLPDRVSMEPGDGGPDSGKVKVRLNLGYRFGAEEQWELPKWKDGQASCQNVANLGTDSIAGLTQFGTLDVLRHGSTSAVNAGVALGPFGGGAGTSLSRTLVDLVDVNGDGLPDHVARDHGGDFRVKLNLGDHWGPEQNWSDPDWPGGDLNHHGGLFNCLDAVNSSGDVNGNGSLGAPICIPLVFAGIQIEASVQAAGSDGGGQISLEDFNGDGLADRVLKGKGSTVHVKLNKAQKANLLVKVDRPLGGTIALEYQRQGNRVDRSNPVHKIDMPETQWVLAATVLADGRGHEYRTTYEYFNDAFYDRLERESYGYARVKTTLSDGSTIDRYFQNQSFYSRSLMTREVMADAAGNLFQVHTSRYAETPASGSSRFPALVEETTAFYEGTARIEGTPPKSTRMTYEYDAQGNVTGTTDFADSGTEDDVTATITYKSDPETGITRATHIDVKDGAGRLLRQRQGTFDDKGNLTRLEQTLNGGRDPETGATYSGSRNPVWTFSYDTLGNLASSVNPTGLTVSFAYDSTARTYPVQVSDSFGYVTQYAYDLKYGHLTETIDQNGNKLRRAYDGFGRLTSIVGPYDSDASPALTFEYGPGNPISWAVVHHKDATRSDSIDSATFTDSLGRVLQTKEDAEVDLASGMRVSGPVEFDVKGRVASQGQPVFVAGSDPANQFVDVQAKNKTAMIYDVLDRVRKVTFPHGAVTSVDYGFGSLDGVSRFLTTRIDPNSRATRSYRDVDGNVLGVEQVNAKGNVLRTARYDYDALNQLTSVRDAKGSTTRLEHDTLGRNVVLDNPDLGRTELRYDPAGNLKAKITANLAALGQQIRYLYTFNRLDRIDYPQSPDVVFTYGPPNAPFNRAGRIATVTDESGVEERSYGKLGEVVQTVKTTTALNGNSPKGPYTTRFQFDSFNRLLSVVYPDGEALTYGYDAGGQVKSASGVLRGVRFDYLRHMGYDEFGARARVVYGNGVETRYAYDPQSRFLSQLRTTGAGRDLQNLQYAYDLTGTIQAIRNEVPVPNPSFYGGPASQTFRYDDLYQLVGAQGTYQSGPNKTSSYSLSLAYDVVGNTTAKNQLHQTSNGGKPKTEQKTSYNWAYTYGGPQPHAPTRIGDRTFRYDLNGNQTGWETDRNGTRRTLTWNEENRLTSVADNGKTTRFLYDAGGMRTNKAGQHGETTYVNRWFSIRNGAIASKHVYADDVRLSTKVSPDPEPPSEKVYFYQGDHLGSTQFVTDDQGTVYQHLEYFPSGEIWVDERSETQRTPYLFSGKELDEETGLSYFGFRYYEARQGQWISADPILDGILNTARLARPDLSGGAFHLPGLPYGYVGNSPINHVDPLGLMQRESAAAQVISGGGAPAQAVAGPAPAPAAQDQHQVMLDAMINAGIQGARALEAAYRDSEGAYRAGYRYQIEGSYYFHRRGQLEGIEVQHNWEGRRADAMLTDGTCVEFKNVRDWNADVEAAFEGELDAYARTGMALRIFMKHAAPRRIQAMIQRYAARSRRGALWTLGGARVLQPPPPPPPPPPARRPKR